MRIVETVMQDTPGLEDAKKVLCLQKDLARIHALRPLLRYGPAYSRSTVEDLRDYTFHLKNLAFYGPETESFKMHAAHAESLLVRAEKLLERSERELGSDCMDYLKREVLR